MSVKINTERVLRDLYGLRRLGAYKTGVHRPTLSADDMVSRRWLADELSAIGHDARIDGIANVVGMSKAPGRKILAGSHIESQNEAGWLDGALGVVYALEAARVIASTPGYEDVGVDVIAFADEEGHFGNFFGSYSFVGELEEATIDAARDRTRGTLLREALRDAGLDGRERLQLQKGRYIGFLEAHIEQGDWLESNDLKIGVVTSIVSISQFRIVFEGTQNHAGTTRMAIRRDAGVAAVNFCHHIESVFPKHAGKHSVWTTGRITLEPGAPSIIPGRAEVLFQFRDADPEKLAELEAVLAQCVDDADRAGPCSARLETIAKSIPARMDEGIQAALEAAGEKHAPGQCVRMPSGAGHDAQIIARYLPAGMLFVPSIGGISHHWTEDTSDEDIVTGARVYADAVAALLKP
ncbi:MAG: Zn-dependent hydrolase [Alphaproteobacteria bacterium]|nr:Zn-dependent hydrolase [Alphaproteobacteria bacterium]